VGVPERNEQPFPEAVQCVDSLPGSVYPACSKIPSPSRKLFQRLGDQTALARVLRYWGLIALHEGDYGAAEAFASEAVELARARAEQSL